MNARDQNTNNVGANLLWKYLPHPLVRHEFMDRRFYLRVADFVNGNQIGSTINTGTDTSVAIKMNLQVLSKLRLMVS